MTKRALILAGGGLKVAFQAGVLQVWLDEARIDGEPIEFEIADGTSGGTFNLAMFCQGMTGTQIANNWRTFNPSSGIAPNLPGALLGPFGPGLFNFSKYVSSVFPEWGLDFERINASPVEASFNAFDFAAQELVAVPPAELDAQRLAACNSLAFWFPPVTVDGSPHLDAVYVTDANIEQALGQGADEIWVIWTLSTRGRWRPGFWQQYFQAIEEAGNGTFARVLARIEASNAAGVGFGEFPQQVCVRLLQAEVPLNYIFNFRRDRMAAAVEQGVRAARTWCDERGIAHAPAPSPVPPPDPQSPGLRFDDSMHGTVDGAQLLTLEMSVHIYEIEKFVTDPDHEASITGHVVSEHFGGSCPIQLGRLNLLTFTEDPGDSRMHYVLQFRDKRTLEPRTLIGDKIAYDDPGWDMWSDTTTLHFDIWPGSITEPPEDGSEPLERGVVRISPLGFLRQQLSMRAQVHGFPDSRLAVIARFYGFFLGRLWDVYAQRVLPWSPF